MQAARGYAVGGYAAWRPAILALGIAMMLAAPGCSRIRLPRMAPATSNELEKLDLLQVVQKEVTRGRDGRAVLTLGLMNEQSQTLWIRAGFDAPGERDDCKVVKSIQAGRRATFVCAQSELVPGADYRVEVSVYRDLGQSNLAERSTLRFEFTTADVEQLQTR